MEKMKTNLINLFIIAFLLLGTSAQAQNANEARKVLDKTASIVGRKGGAKATFTLSSTKYGNASGTIAIKGNKFNARTSQAIIWYNGKTQWSYLTATEEVNITTPNEAQQAAMNPYKFITIYKTGFNLSMTTKGNNYVVHMTAQNKKRSVQEMYITINKKTYVPSQVKMKQGSVWTTLDIANFQAKDQSDNIFIFNAKEFPNSEVIDLR